VRIRAPGVSQLIRVFAGLGWSVAWLAKLLNARSRQEMAGLVLAEPRWQLTGLKDPSILFGSLLQLVPAGAYLFLEGGAHPPQLRAWLERRNVETTPRPALGTIWPAAHFFSVSITPEVLSELAELTRTMACPEVCFHLHVFSDDQVLVSGYDAFSDPLYVSAAVPEDRVKRFCDLAGCAYENA
jgi:hypothetical protein